MRIKNVFRNSFFGLLSQVMWILIGFVSQRVMNMKLGEEFVGMNGVINNIISILSVTELGISSAIVFHLYQAIEDNDEAEISRLMNFYRLAYYCFATVVTVLGLIVLPIVPVFFKGSTYSDFYIRILFLMWLLRTSISYLLTYKRSMLIADQKEYVVSIVTLFLNLINYSVIIVVLLCSKDYLIALGINIVVDIILNCWLNQYIDKKYEFLKKYRREKVEKSFVKKMFNDLKNIFVSKLCLKLLVSTDNLIISSFINVAVVGLYSNYCLVTQSIMNVMTAVSNAIMPTVGHMFTEKDSKKNYDVLRQVTFIFAVVSAFAGASLISLISIFVKDFWLSERFVLPNNIVFILVMTTYVYMLNLPITMVMEASGMFEKDKKISVAVAVTNLVVSLGLVKIVGLFGVILGTLCAYTLQLVLRTVAFFKDYLKTSIKWYAVELVEYVITGIGESALVYYLVNLVYHNGGMLRFFFSMVICVVVPFGISIVLYGNTWRGRSVLGLVQELRGKNE